jgi:hypothetical protein
MASETYIIYETNAATGETVARELTRLEWLILRYGLPKDTKKKDAEDIHTAACAKALAENAALEAEENRRGDAAVHLALHDAAALGVVLDAVTDPEARAALKVLAGLIEDLRALVLGGQYDA